MTMLHGSKLKIQVVLALLPNSVPTASEADFVLGLKLFFVTGLVIFIAAVARLDCPDLLG